MKYLAFILFFLLSGCGIFEPRDVEPPTVNRSNFTQPTSPDIVILNLNYAIAERNVNNYMKCFIDTNYISKTFTFIPDAVSQGQYPVFNNWNISKEETYFNNLTNLTDIASTSNLFLTDMTSTLYGDSAVYDYTYLLRFDHNRANVAKTMRGKLRFILSADTRNLWGISSWTDFRTNQNDTTWSVLKANFSN